MGKRIRWAALILLCLSRPGFAGAEPVAAPNGPNAESVLRASFDFLAALTNFSVGCTRAGGPSNLPGRAFEVSGCLPERLQVFSEEYFQPVIWDYNAGKITLFWTESGERKEHPADTADFPFSRPDQAEDELGLHHTLYMVDMLTGHLADRILSHATAVADITRGSYSYNGAACRVIRVEQDDQTAFELIVQQGDTPFIHVIKHLSQPPAAPETPPAQAPVLAQEFYRRWQMNSPDIARLLDRINAPLPEVQDVFEQAWADCDLALRKLRNGETLSAAERQRCSDAPERYFEAISHATGLKQNYNFPAVERTQFYRLAIAAGIVDWDRHGGWAFKSEIRLHVLSQLKAQYDENPDSFTAFCLLFLVQGAGIDEPAGQLFDFLCAHDDFLAREAVRWSFRAAANPDWFIDRYLAQGGPDRTETLLHDLQTANDQTDLEFKARIFERLGRYSEAESCYKQIETEQEYVGDLVDFYLRCRDRKDDAGATFQQRYDELISRCFPGGLRKVELADFSAAPSAGVLFTEDNFKIRQSGMKRGTVIVALDGYRVDNLTQYYVVRQMDAAKARMELIVWDDGHYKAVGINVPNRRFGLDIQSYSAAKVGAGGI